MTCLNKMYSVNLLLSSVLMFGIVINPCPAEFLLRNINTYLYFLNLFNIDLMTCFFYQIKTFSVSLALCTGNSPVNSPQKGQWRGAFITSLTCTWINGWVNSRGAGDLRRHGTHNDVTVMEMIQAHGRQGLVNTAYSNCMLCLWFVMALQPDVK